MWISGDWGQGGRKKKKKGDKQWKNKHGLGNNLNGVTVWYWNNYTVPRFTLWIWAREKTAQKETRIGCLGWGVFFPIIFFFQLSDKIQRRAFKTVKINSCAWYKIPDTEKLIREQPNYGVFSTLVVKKRLKTVMNQIIPAKPTRSCWQQQIPMQHPHKHSKAVIPLLYRALAFPGVEVKHLCMQQQEQGKEVTWKGCHTFKKCHEENRIRQTWQVKMVTV